MDAKWSLDRADGRHVLLFRARVGRQDLIYNVQRTHGLPEALRKEGPGPTQLSRPAAG